MALSLEAEIAALRDLLRQCGSDDPEERDTAMSEAKGVSRVVSVLVRAVAVQAALEAADRGGDTLPDVIARALEELKRGAA
jgi:hypothetical protein